MGRILENNRAEQEANEIAFKFMNSNDVVRDMSAAYNTDFSKINLHSDSSSDSKVRAAGKDAIASGNDIFFGKGILESNHPESKGLLAHELAHTMQQGTVESAGAVSESVSAGEEQGGILDWFRRKHHERKIKKMQLTQGSAAPAKDVLSRGYMDSMKAKEFELGMAGMAESNMPKIALSNEKMKGNESKALLISYALQALGHRTEKKDAALRGYALRGTQDKYKDYYEAVAASQNDFVSGNQEFASYQRDGIAPYQYNDMTNEITGGLLQTLESSMFSDDMQNYSYNFVNSLKDADVFKERSIYDYLLQTVFTGEGATMFKGRNAGTYNQTGAEENARKNVFAQATKNINLLPILASESPEVIETLPPSLQALFRQYEELKAKIAAHVEVYGKQK